MKKIIALSLSLSCLIFGGCGRTVVSNTADVKTEPQTSSVTTAESSTKKSDSKSTTKTTKKNTTVTTTKSAAPPSDVKIEFKDTLEIYENISLGDFVTDTNVELKNKDSLVKSNKLGSNKIKVYYSYDGSDFSTELSYEVKDTTPPLLINTGWNTKHRVGTPFNLEKYVGYGDNYDSKPVLTYTGEVDTEKVGIYPLHAVVTDSSGNTSEFDISIQVLNDTSDSPDDKPRVDFKDFVKKYKGDNVSFGIDVSTWQGDIDFDAVKKAGCEFVIMRIGCYYTSYDDIKIDDWYTANMEKAKKAGLDVGVYVYTTDNTKDGIKKHSKWIADTLGGEKLDFPVVFDWEEWTNFQEYELSLHDLNSLYSLFSDEMEKYGYSAMLYSSRNLLRTIWDDNSKSINPVWLAHFVDDTDYEGDYQIWQASCYGNIDGIVGDVDMNILYKDK